MDPKLAWILFLLAHLSETDSQLNVHIKIEPPTVKVGDDLKVTCTILGDSIDKEFQTLLKCPFNDRDTVCISNCDSMDICSSPSCNRKMVGNQFFQCVLSESPTSLVYSYEFISLSSASVKLKNHLSFTCTFKGQEASGFANISKTVSTTVSPSKPNEVETSTLSVPAAFSFLRFRDFILLGLIGALLISFFINVWCTVQWGITKCKTRNTQKRLKTQKLMQEENSQSNYKELISHHFKKYESQSSSLNNESTPSKSHTGSMSYKPAYRIPFQVLDDYELTRGSNPSLLNSRYPQMVITPIQYIDQSMLSYMTPISSYNPSIHMNNESNQSQNNFEILSDLENNNSSMISSPIKEPSENTYERNSDF